MGSQKLGRKVGQAREVGQMELESGALGLQFEIPGSSAEMEPSGAAPPRQGLLRRESSRLASLPRAEYTGTQQLRGNLTVKLLQQRARLAKARATEARRTG